VVSSCFARRAGAVDRRGGSPRREERLRRSGGSLRPAEEPRCPPPFRCDIIGTGPLEPALAALILERQLQDHVHLVGPRPRSEVVALVRGAAVFAAPCVVAADGDRDGLPTVLVEAMALGTPCVSTDVTGIPELLADDCGIVVPQHDPANLAAALERLLS